MDYRLLLTTFVTVFLAELGDKTQLATFAFASSDKRISAWPVFLGAALALIATSAIAAFAGGAVSQLISPTTLKRVSAAGFLAAGLWMLRT